MTGILAGVDALVEAARAHERLLAQRTLDTHVFQVRGRAALDAVVAERDAAGQDVANRVTALVAEVEAMRKAMRNALGHVDHNSIHYILKVALGDEVRKW
jgi:hypothetical protein